jgi:hypothetical protein
MRELFTHLSIVGTCGVVALLAGPLAQLPINLGAWLLEWLCRPTRAGDPRRAALHDSVNGITRWRTAPGLQPAPPPSPTAAPARAMIASMTARIGPVSEGWSAAERRAQESHI